MTLPTLAELTAVLPLRTERLVLRPGTPDDVDAVLAYCSRDDVTRYLPFGVLDRDGVEARVERWRADLDREPSADPDRAWMMTLVAELDGAVVGDVMLRVPGGERRTVAELGYVFSPAVAGRGLATEAARAVVDLAFGLFGCHRVHAQLDPRNTASARLLERLGMTHEAHLRRDWWGKGAWSDTAVYGLLREEWTAR
ncbi:GNAT family protein [Nocardioides sp. C4-1]|uniref:GNAT family N-acetyltransferase n=1 Tax=Nocardioides sp. C4-1 TaxID=3151851 RepID=UPI00326603C9